MRKQQSLLKQIKALAANMVAVEPRLKLVVQEADTSTKINNEAATFLKFKGKRLGRDLELYVFTSEIASVHSSIVMNLEEIVTPLQASSPNAFATGLAELRKFKVFGKCQDKWLKLLSSMELPS